jgi:hypothetical protein
MSLHKETSFETKICENITPSGLYAEGDTTGYAGEGTWRLALPITHK